MALTNNEQIGGGGTLLMEWVDAAVPTPDLRC